MEIDWGCPRAAAPSSPRPDRTGLLVSLHTRESRVWRHIRGESWPQTGGEGQVVLLVVVVVVEAAGGGEHFEAIGGDVRFAQAQGWCLNMLPTNTAPVSLSSSLFSVTMYSPASSPGS